MIFFLALFVTLLILGTASNVTYRDTAQEALCLVMLFLFIWSGLELVAMTAEFVWGLFLIP